MASNRVLAAGLGRLAAADRTVRRCHVSAHLDRRLTGIHEGVDPSGRQWRRQGEPRSLGGGPRRQRQAEAGPRPAKQDTVLVEEEEFRPKGVAAWRARVGELPITWLNSSHSRHSSLSGHFRPQ